MEKASYLGHRERIKNKFKVEGLKPFQDHEVLELLLTFAIPRKDTKKLAWALIKSFGSFEGVLDASYFELQKIEGLGPQSAILINLIREIITRYSYNRVKKQRRIGNQEELYNYCMAHLKNKREECFEVLFLDIKLRLLATEVLAFGDIDRAAISPRRLVELVLKYGAKNIICVHNHPSGDPTPSNEDKVVTEQLKNALEVLAVRLIDHIVIGDGKIYSLSSKNYIEKPKIFL